MTTKLVSLRDAYLDWAQGRTRTLTPGPARLDLQRMLAAEVYDARLQLLQLAEHNTEDSPLFTLDIRCLDCGWRWRLEGYPVDILLAELARIRRADHGGGESWEMWRRELAAEVGLN